MRNGGVTRSDLDEQGDGDEYGKDEHATEPVEVQRSAAGPIHEWDGDERHDYHDGPDSDGCILGSVIRKACRREQRRRII